MQAELRSYIPTSRGVQIITLFGYTSRSLPALEINGLSGYNQLIKEKIIYLSKTRQLKIPAKRYVISVEFDEEVKKQVNLSKYLEYPILIMYWYLAGQIPIRKLDDCITSGGVDITGVISHQYPTEKVYDQLLEKLQTNELNKYKYIGLSENFQDLWHIDGRLLLNHIPNLKFTEV